MKGLCSAVFRQPYYLMSISFMIFIIFTIYYYLQCSVCLLSSHPFTFCRLGAWQDPVCLSCICPLPFSSPLYPHLPLSSTASGMQAFEQGRRASLLEGRVLTLLPSPDEPYRIQQRCIKEYPISGPSGASWVKKAEKPSTSCTHRSHSSLKSIVVFS